MDLIPDPPGRIIRGKIFINGYNILNDLERLVTIRVRSPDDVRIRRRKRLIKRHNYIMSGIRGDKVSMIFQEPFLSLNPVMTIGEQIKEALHKWATRLLSTREAWHLMSCQAVP